MTFTDWSRFRAWWSGGAEARRAVKWLQGYRGDAFWAAYKEGVWSRDLVEAALCRSHTLTPCRDRASTTSFRRTMTCAAW